ncbi:MAG TPA: aminopeptidase P N-terminal domain-containing protein [Terracidiphilus sp.]|nr:aminopeptidase P N-terminal domain-containing protein [Terracidiphilus sp.]
MKSLRRMVCSVLVLLLLVTVSSALEKQPTSTYHGRRVALAAELKGGVAVLFAAEEPVLDFMPYRQDSDFYYLTGWNEPGAALMIVGASDQTGHSRNYREILFLPTRNLRTETYTGPKMDSKAAGVIEATGVDAVEQMTELPAELNKMIASDRSIAQNVWTQPDAKQAKALVDFSAATLGIAALPATHDVTGLIMPLREVKDAGEIELLKKASAASVAAQRAMMRVVKAGITERTIAGRMTELWFEQGCERPSYAPIVGSGVNSTTLHYSANAGTVQDGDVVLVDAACEYSMYASDITRTVPANGHFTARQREIYDIVLGAQQAAIDAFVAGKSKINDFYHRDSDSLDLVAYNYINTHGKDLHGEPLGKYWRHGLGHMVGIDVHDPAQYPAVLRPGMVFTIEPGVYIPEEKLGVRIECDFLVGADGKLIDLDADLPHTAEEVEAAMKRR